MRSRFNFLDFLGLVLLLIALIAAAQGIHHENEVELERATFADHLAAARQDSLEHNTVLYRDEFLAWVQEVNALNARMHDLEPLVRRHPRRHPRRHRRRHHAFKHTAGDSEADKKFQFEMNELHLFYTPEYWPALAPGK